MSPATLSTKMKLKAGYSAAVVNAPEGYLKELAAPDGVAVSTSLRGKYDWIQVFVKNKAELDKIVSRAAGALKPVSLLWISFPKGTSKIQTDLTRDKGWDALQKADKDFEVMFYPHARHGIGERHYNRLQIEFMKRALRVSP